jgi:hypothetical protein
MSLKTISERINQMADKTIGKVTTTEPKVTRRINTNLVDATTALYRWIQFNIVPVIALPVLAILAADDIKIHLVVTNHTHLSNEFGLLVGIAVAALLMVSTAQNKK